MSMPDEAKTRETLSLLRRSFVEVLASVGETDVAARLPWPELDGEAAAVRDDWPDTLAERCMQAYSIAFQLLQQAEENAVAQGRRRAEAAGRLTEDPGSWDQHFARLQHLDVSAQEIADAVATVRIEPVLTAHPTEAKRQTVLDHHRTLYRTIVELENTMWTSAERAALETELRAAIERLWRTGEIYLDKPSVADELRNVMHYLCQVFPIALPWVERRLHAAWQRAGFDPALIDGAWQRLGLTFGDWVGGDRDGHPFVTVEITEQTLAAFRHEAVSRLRETLSRLAAGLSLSTFRQSAPPELAAWIEARAAELGEAGARATRRNPDEPWRQAVNLLIAALPKAAADAPAHAYAECNGLIADLARIRRALVSVGAERLAASDVDPVLRQIRSFGFHLATLDMRQNSAFHDRALVQLLAIAGIEDAASYPSWDGQRRLELLRQELRTPRPFAHPHTIPDGEAASILALYRLLSHHLARHGTAGLGALIVSMTRSAADLLAVFVLARDAGLLRDDGDGPWCPLAVVPLFETIGDLEGAAAILDVFLAEPAVARSLARQAMLAGEERPVQQVMIGYSDSGKDGGYAAAFWGLFRAQLALTEVGRRHGVRVRFFHGRGGSIGRGAGPTHRFLQALPSGTLAGDLRLTEQGEIIAQKYANRVSAAHHLELLLAGTVAVTLYDRHRPGDPEQLCAAMDAIAARSRAAYRALVEADGFITFFEQATPIDVIEQSRIGSRPARRTGERSLADLRAIPWVFAWNQCRALLPGWFGLGTALLALRDDDPSVFQALVHAKAEATRWPPFHYMISNAATACAQASPEVFTGYAGLVEDADLRQRLSQVILQEYQRTLEALAAIYGAPIGDARASVARAMALRHRALVPLHNHQIALIRRWRAARQAGEAHEAEALLRRLLLSVNAIASGLGATG